MRAATVPLHSDGSDLEAAGDVPSGRRPRCPPRRAGALVVVAGLLVASVVVTGRAKQHARSTQRGDVGSGVDLFLLQAASLLGAAFEGIEATNKAVEKADEALEKFSKEGEKRAFTAESLANETGSHLYRNVSMHDDNLCADDEELFAGLCYKKCSLFDEDYPIRTSAFSCCQSRPCGLFNSRESSLLHWCSGYSVSGDHAGHSHGACPHTPGVCYQDEELYLGMCYMKCALLTNNTHPFRNGPSTCCEVDSFLACTDPLYAVTDPAFDIGGGKGDGKKETLSYAHPPLPTLTEA